MRGRADRGGQGRAAAPQGGGGTVLLGGGSTRRGRDSLPAVVEAQYRVAACLQVHEHEDFVRPENAYNIEDIRRLAHEEVALTVTKSADGTLRVNVREDTDEDHRGLFVHSFKKESVAEREGQLRARRNPGGERYRRRGKRPGTARDCAQE